MNDRDKTRTSRPLTGSGRNTDFHRWSEFRERFPEQNDVANWFQPGNWELFVGPIDGRVAVRPCPTLQDLAAEYCDKDLPRSIVRNQLHSLAILSSSSFSVSSQAIDLAVGQFVGRYAKQCTLYQLMTYFANYPEYKRTLATFDLQDVVLSFQRFQQKWTEAADQVAAPAKTSVDPHGGIVGLARYIRRETSRHPLGVHGFCRDSHLVSRVDDDPDSRTELEQEERDRQEAEAAGRVYQGGVRIGLSECLTPSDIRAVMAAPSDREAGKHLAEAVRHHFERAKNRKRLQTPL